MVLVLVRMSLRIRSNVLVQYVEACPIQPQPGSDVSQNTNTVRPRTGSVYIENYEV